MPGHIPLYLATAVVLVLLFNALLTLLAFRPLLKPALIVLFVTTAFAVHFMIQYGVVIDATMIQNVFETDLREATELLSWKLAITVIMLGLLPSLAIWRLRLEAPPLWSNLATKLAIVCVSLPAAAGIVVLNYKIYAPTFREHASFVMW